MREVAKRRGFVAGITETKRKSLNPQVQSSSSPHLQRSSSLSKATQFHSYSLCFIFFYLSVAYYHKLKLLVLVSPEGVGQTNSLIEGAALDRKAMQLLSTDKTIVLILFGDADAFCLMGMQRK